MKKLLFFGVALTSVVDIAFAATSDCLYCEGNTPSTPVVAPSSSQCLFCGDNGTTVTYWTAATERTVNFYSDGAYAGVATIKTGTISKGGAVAVSITFKTTAGKKYSAKKKSFTPDTDGTLNCSWSVSGLGTVQLSISPDGEVDGIAGSYTLSQEGSEEIDLDDGDIEHGAHTFTLTDGDYALSEKYDFIAETIPDSVEIVTSNNKKWDCGSAPKIKYVTVQEDGEKRYELSGLDDEFKTNYSSLTIKFNSKKKTISGSFKVLASNEVSTEKGKPKIKTYTFKLQGSCVGSKYTGTATCKALKANWTFEIE